MKLQENVAAILSSFATSIGNTYRFKLVCNQVASMLGQVKIDTTEGRWKVSATGILTQGTKNKAKLPMNNPAAVLFRFALALDELTEQGEFQVDAELPKPCRAWINNLPQSASDTTPVTEQAVEA